VKAHLAAICLVILLAGSVCASAEDPPRVMRVDGRSFSGSLVSLSKAEAVFRTDTGSRSVPLTQLWSIRFDDSDDVMSQPGRTVIALAGAKGQWLAAGKLTVQGGKITVDSGLLGRAVIDMSAARAIYLPRRSQLPASCRKRHLEMRLPPASHDYLVAEDAKGNWVPAAGVLKSIADGKVRFEYEGEVRTIAVSAVRAIELARMVREADPPIGYLVGRDGSTVGFTSLGLAGASLSLAADGLSAKAVDLAAVAEIRFVSDRSAYLSELEPVKVVQVGLFDVAFSYRRDRSTAGSPLRVGGVTYAKGLGLHSRCELAYDLAGEYATFAAVAGIDDAAAGRGNAELRVLGDGKELIKPVKLLGRGEPVPVRCDVAGVKHLTLLVDFGDDRVDVGDHVSLAEARLIKP